MSLYWAFYTSGSVSVYCTYCTLSFELGLNNNM